MQGKWIGVVLAACIMTTGCATRQAEKTAAPATPDVQAQVKPSTQQEPRASAAPSQSKLPAAVPDTKSQTHEPERGKADAPRHAIATALRPLQCSRNQLKRGTPPLVGGGVCLGVN